MRTPTEIAAQLWCLPKHSRKVMDVDLAQDIAKAIEEERVTLYQEIEGLKKERVNDYARAALLISWLQKNPRQPANGAFTAGPERQVGYAIEKVLAEAAREAALGILVPLREWWSFDHTQRHTHSWHTREDFIEKMLNDHGLTSNDFREAHDGKEPPAAREKGD